MKTKVHLHLCKVHAKEIRNCQDGYDYHYFLNNVHIYYGNIHRYLSIRDNIYDYWFLQFCTIRNQASLFKENTLKRHYNCIWISEWREMVNEDEDSQSDV